jgi:hypothetical protein
MTAIRMPSVLGPEVGPFGAGVNTVVNTLSFSPSTSVASAYDDSLLRQGQTLPITDLLSTVPGTMTAQGTLDIQYGVYNDPLGGTNLQPAGTPTAAKGATGSGSYTEVQKAASVSYAGALSGGPNKTVTLSAVLKDATGLPLTNKTITFVLGSQPVSAQTGSTGVATTSLKLTQKNGKYSLTATFTPTGGDTNLYTGNSASATFALQSK